MLADAGRAAKRGAKRKRRYKRRDYGLTGGGTPFLALRGSMVAVRVHSRWHIRGSSPNILIYLRPRFTFSFFHVQLALTRLNKILSSILLIRPTSLLTLFGVTAYSCNMGRPVYSWWHRGKVCQVGGMLPSICIRNCHSHRCSF